MTKRMKWHFPRGREPVERPQVEATVSAGSEEALKMRVFCVASLKNPRINTSMLEQILNS